MFKWVGGKTQIIDKIISKIPRTIKCYYEPFVGGGSVFLKILETPDIHIEHMVISDINSDLIHTYKTIQMSPNELIQDIQRIINNKPFTEELYYKLRDDYNIQPKNTLRAAVLFIILNKTCFRGVYRIGPHGFNVPFGHYKSVNISSDYILHVSKLVKNVEFLTCSFQDIFKRQFNIDDFLYLDPPYIQLNKTSFISYNIDKFDINASKELFEL